MNLLWEIWIGKYQFGEEGLYSTVPKKIGEEWAKSFKLACLKYELRSKLQFIEEQEKMDYVFNKQDFEWFYLPETNGSAWIGKYYPSYEEALKSFQ